MQFTQILSLLALAPFLAVASPVDAEDFASVNRFPLEARGGIDFCGSDLRSAGGACTFGSGEKDPHACDFNNRQSVLYCRDNHWVVDHSCASGQVCRCDKNNPKRGNLVCR